MIKANIRGGQCNVSVRNVRANNNVMVMLNNLIKPTFFIKLVNGNYHYVWT